MNRFYKEGKFLETKTQKVEFHPETGLDDDFANSFTPLFAYLGAYRNNTLKLIGDPADLKEALTSPIASYRGHIEQRSERYNRSTQTIDSIISASDATNMIEVNRLAERCNTLKKEVLKKFDEGTLDVAGTDELWAALEKIDQFIHAKKD